jgi:hypothetical protein
MYVIRTAECVYKGCNFSDHFRQFAHILCGSESGRLISAMRYRTMSAIYLKLGRRSWQGNEKDLQSQLIQRGQETTG